MHIPRPAAKKSRRAKIEAYHQLMESRHGDRIASLLAPETVNDLRKMIKRLDIKDAFEAKEETSFPRTDYSPYIAHVDCKDKSRPSSRPGSPSSSDDGDQ